VQAIQRIAVALARAAAVRSFQLIDPALPSTWEVSGFSQNGEDGITDFLTRRLISQNKYFVEIGASDGLENNTSWLAIALRWRGLMIEGNKKKSDLCRRIMSEMALGVEVVNIFVGCENIQNVLSRAATIEPDFFSLDIDGVDWHVARAMLRLGFRPKIVVAEYNSCFGPDAATTVPYRPDFDFISAHPSNLYYGASIRAWRALLEEYGYHFITVERNGVNAYFARPDCFGEGLLENIRTQDFAENYYQLTRHGCSWEGQLAIVNGLPLLDISREMIRA
jgi:hypothetical protein